jgi:hypothetical protein
VLWLTSMAFGEERQGESKVAVARDAKRRGNILASGGGDMDERKSVTAQ